MRLTSLNLPRSVLMCVALLSPMPALAELPAPRGHVLITLGGTVSQSNLAPRSAEDGGLLGYLEVSYDAAAGFDAAMLDGLPQHDITIAYGPQGNTRDIAFSGPLLADVMRMAGAEGKTALPMAMDGYQATIPWSDIADHTPILATHADGRPMGIGAYGPTMVVFPPATDEDTRQTQASQQVWALAYIGIE